MPQPCFGDFSVLSKVVHKYLKYKSLCQVGEKWILKKIAKCIDTMTFQTLGKLRPIHLYSFKMIYFLKFKLYQEFHGSRLPCTQI